MNKKCNLRIVEIIIIIIFISCLFKVTGKVEKYNNYFVYRDNLIDNLNINIKCLRALDKIDNNSKADFYIKIFMS